MKLEISNCHENLYSIPMFNNCLEVKQEMSSCNTTVYKSGNKFHACSFLIRPQWPYVYVGTHEDGKAIVSREPHNTYIKTRLASLHWPEPVDSKKAIAGKYAVSHPGDGCKSELHKL